MRTHYPPSGPGDVVRGPTGTAKAPGGPPVAMSWLRGVLAREARVALFVDGPNVLRSEFDVDLDEVRTIGESYGPLSATRLYLDENASPGLIQAGEARGFE